MLPDEICLSADLSADHTAKTAQRLFAEFWTLDGLTAIFAGLEPAGVFNLKHFARESPDNASC
jgi:hypothetical protein